MGDKIWKLFGTAGAVGSGILANKVLTTVYGKVRGGTPPINPESDDTAWGEALAWAILSGATVGAARLIFRRKAAAAFVKVTGYVPGNLESAH